MYLLAALFLLTARADEADLPKSGIYGRVWATPWDVFRRTPYRDGRGRRPAVEFVVGFECGGISFFVTFFASNAHGLLRV